MGKFQLFGYKASRDVARQSLDQITSKHYNETAMMPAGKSIPKQYNLDKQPLNLYNSYVDRLQSRNRTLAWAATLTLIGGGLFLGSFANQSDQRKGKTVIGTTLGVVSFLSAAVVFGKKSRSMDVENIEQELGQQISNNMPRFQALAVSAGNKTIQKEVDQVDAQIKTTGKIRNYPVSLKVLATLESATR